MPTDTGLRRVFKEIGKGINENKSKIITRATIFSIAVIAARALSNAIDFQAPSDSVADIEDTIKSFTAEQNNIYRNTPIPSNSYPNMTCGTEDVYLQNADILTYLDPALCEPGALQQILDTTPFWQTFIDNCVPLIREYCQTINALQHSLAEKHEQQEQYHVVIPTTVLTLIITAGLAVAELQYNAPSRAVAWVGNRLYNSACKIGRGAQYLGSLFSSPAAPLIVASDEDDEDIEDLQATNSPVHGRASNG